MSEGKTNMHKTYNGVVEHICKKYCENQLPLSSEKKAYRGNRHTDRETHRETGSNYVLLIWNLGLSKRENTKYYSIPRNLQEKS